ncbi:hypothetical protein [Legionella worsleiensis]|uniref:hypothetical protein n=1 Tax=Legionella worsleiensis TaxID=45076 RepID=UPI000AABAFC2|nr:hypothetical protein [Legionella worsleiensis]
MRLFFFTFKIEIQASDFFNWYNGLFQITILHGVVPFVDYVLAEQSTEYPT